MVAGSSPAGRTVRIGVRWKNPSPCVSSRSVSTEMELRRAFSSAGSERSPHTREVTGSSPVLPTTQQKPRTQVRGFLLAFVSSLLGRGEPKQTKRISSAGLLKGCGSLPPCVHRAKRSSPVDSLFKLSQRRRRKKPRTEVQGFKVGNRKESESVCHRELGIWQHPPKENIVGNVS